MVLRVGCLDPEDLVGPTVVAVLPVAPLDFDLPPAFPLFPISAALANSSSPPVSSLSIRAIALATSPLPLEKTSGWRGTLGAPVGPLTPPVPPGSGGSSLWGFLPVP